MSLCVSMNVCLKMFHGQNVYFARSNHDDDAADDDDDGDGDTPPRESSYRNTHNELNTTGTFTWREIFNLPPSTHVWIAIFIEHTQQNMTMTMEKLLANEFSPENGNYNFTRN